MASTGSSEMTIEELDMSHIKVEVASDSDESVTPSDRSAEEESKGVAADAVKAVKSEEDTCERSLKKVQGQPRAGPRVKILKRARLQSDGTSTFSIVARTYDLMKEFSLMAEHPKSVKCSQFSCGPKIAVCQGCGNMFGGKGHLYRLMSHIKAKHRRESEKLIMDIIERFHKSIETMRRMLHSDMKNIYKYYEV